MRNVQGFINRGGGEDDESRQWIDWIEDINVWNMPELESL